MLRKLTVKNLAVVESAAAEFGPGLNVITGETGAGKSVLMGALELVLGGRADSSVVREGAKEAEVEADFGDIVVRRTVTAQGRSRAWVGEESVAVSELKDLSRRLVDVHGPTASQKLVEPSFQRETLDAFGGLNRDAYDRAWSALVALRGEVASLMANDGEADLDFLRFQVDELENAALTEEDETLAERHAAAAHAGEIVENANAVTEALGGDDSVDTRLQSVRSCLAAIARHLPMAEEWASAADELSVRVQELSRAVADEISKLDVGDEDLDALDARLTLLSRLKRKYRATEVAGLLSVLSDKRAKLDALEHREERLQELGAKVAAAEVAVRQAGAELTKRRRAAAAKLAAAVSRELKDLGFLQAKFAVRIEPAEPSATGADEVIYLFEPNPGEPARALAAIASSGEIARVMLALKGVLAAHEPATTMVFDEIDANIGGEIGKVVGEKLRAVAKAHQVLAITHLPQSAACGDRHFKVTKRVEGGRTRTAIVEVKGEDRVCELARMLGGEQLTSVVKRHAKELLEISR